MRVLYFIIMFSVCTFSCKHIEEERVTKIEDFVKFKFDFEETNYIPQTHENVYRYSIKMKETTTNKIADVEGVIAMLGDGGKSLKLKNIKLSEEWPLNIGGYYNIEAYGKLKCDKSTYTVLSTEGYKMTFIPNKIRLTNGNVISNL